ncbi:TetR/AcrR family transcriptional regulator C-terminal domain-containing protein [Fodinicola feengrottensis]|uniref:TetR/AcrR family transcriptional regulator C-terminal domain-containing protein n=1 Tax=Fodinicola feengrottensis TaxID=435914 RepID=UPI002442D64E|nr:TetR/AcrR family transcriptional regulator C-terminal domain-containing protein [Fodinicola feengrottensis]
MAAGADLSRAAALATWLDQTVTVLTDAGFDLHDAVLSAGSLMSFVIGRTAEEQSLPDGKTLRDLQDRVRLKAVARGLATTDRRQSADARARQAVGIFITGLRTILRESQ